MNRAVPVETEKTFEAAAMMAFAMLLLPIMDAAGKYLALFEGVTPGTSSLLRFALQTLFTLPVIVMVSGLAGLRPNYWGANLLRGLLLGWASGLFLISVKYVPIADAIAVFFVEPFILTALSALFLREQVRWPRWLAIVVGFCGALLVIQPNFAAFGFVSLLPLGTATLFAVYLLLNRVYSAHDSPLVMQYAAGIGGFLAIAIVMPLGPVLQLDDISWSTPASAMAVALLVLVGLISAYGHLIIVAAMRLAPASLLAPFQYFEIVTAAIVGYLVFGNFPTLSKWLGIAIIVCSGCSSCGANSAGHCKEDGIFQGESMLLNNLLLGSVVVSATVVIHTFGLIGVANLMNRITGHHPIHEFRSKVISMVVLVHGLLAVHTVEIWLWAVVYTVTDAVNEFGDALYFSAITFSTLGYGDALLDEKWRLLAGMEGLSGFVLIGWSTAYLVAASTRIGPFQAGKHF